MRVLSHMLMIAGLFAAPLFTYPADSAPAIPGSMLVGDYTSQPIGHYEFCKENAIECRLITPDEGPLRLTDKIRTMIATVNVKVNKEIRPLSDMEIYGKDEVWMYPERVGDCEDYVLLKRKMLNQKGIPLSNLLITVVRKPDGEGHAVLTVRTDKGDFVLDNLHSTLLKWHYTGYTYLKRVSSQHTGRWQSILPRPADSTPVASTAGGS